MLRIWEQFAITFLIIYHFDGVQHYCLANSFDPYETLEVQRTSTQDEIRKAYKRLVKKWYYIFY